MLTAFIWLSCIIYCYNICPILFFYYFVQLFLLIFALECYYDAYPISCFTVCPIYYVPNNLCCPVKTCSNLCSSLCPITQRFSTCGPLTTSGPQPCAWWSASKA